MSRPTSPSQLPDFLNIRMSLRHEQTGDALGYTRLPNPARACVAGSGSGVTAALSTVHNRVNMLIFPSFLPPPFHLNAAELLGKVRDADVCYVQLRLYRSEAFCQ